MCGLPVGWMPDKNPSLHVCLGILIVNDVSSLMYSNTTLKWANGSCGSKVLAGVDGRRLRSRP